MTGLLTKDFKLLKLQKKFLLVIVIIAAIFMAIGYDATFLVSYPAFLCSFIVISTIAYDDFNHGTMFLMTLPVTRKGYVQEKYALSFIVCFTAWFISIIAATIYQMIVVSSFNMSEWLATCVILLSLPLFFLLLVLPIQLKYGAEKGRIAMIIAIGIAFIGAFLLIKGLGYLDIDVITFLESLSVMNIAIVGILTMLVTAIISYFISVNIFNKKEF